MILPTNVCYLLQTLLILEVFKKIASLQQWVKLQKLQSKVIGFVPTMGALHEGHLSLVRASKSRCEITICSIFINPTQFNDPTDFEKYPVRVEQDIEMLKAVGCDAVFVPDVAEIYPQAAMIKIHFGPLEEVFEGLYRPGHFNGVAIVVAKLFHMVSPDVAFFGKKDYQQLAIIKRMVSDLSFPVEIVPCDTVREASGLAMSSRNERLSFVTRLKAGIIYQTMQQMAGHMSLHDWPSIKSHIIQHITQELPLELEYLELAHPDTLQPVTPDTGACSNAILLFAGRVEGVRLIDNITVNLI